MYKSYILYPNLFLVTLGKFEFPLSEPKSDELTIILQGSLAAERGIEPLFPG